MFALIFANQVVQIADKTFEVAPSLRWVDISDLADKPETGWLYDGESFSPPPAGPAPPPLTDKEQALAALPKLQEEMVYALAKFVAGELSKDDVKTKWESLKLKLQEAEVTF